MQHDARWSVYHFSRHLLVDQHTCTVRGGQRTPSSRPVSLKGAVYPGPSAIRAKAPAGGGGFESHTMTTSHLSCSATKCGPAYFEQSLASFARQTTWQCEHAATRAGQITIMCCSVLWSTDRGPCGPPRALTRLVYFACSEAHGLAQPTTNLPHIKGPWLARQKASRPRSRCKPPHLPS